MLRTRPAALAAVLLVVAPLLVVATPAALAEVTVPQAPGVRYEPLASFTHRLYLNFDSLPGAANQPNCNTGSLGFGPASLFSGAGAQRGVCAYPIDNGQASAGGQASPSIRTFRTSALVRSINVTGSDSLVYVHKFRESAAVPVGATLTATALSGTRILGSGSYTFGPFDTLDNDGLFVIPIVFTDSATRGLFDVGQPVGLELRASTPPASVTNPGAGAPEYTIDDTGSYLDVRSEDALRAAAWVGDPGSPLPKTVFRPVAASTPLAQAPRIQFYFSVQSAFGLGDASLRGDPVFSLKRNGETVFLTPQNDSTRGSDKNDSLRLSEAGIMGWSLPGDNPLDYRGFLPGEYVLQVTARHSQGATISKGDQARFFITAQGARLDPYAEDRSTLSPETLGHDVAPGGSTTYLLLVNNTGSANDTFRVDASFVTGSPASGWGAVVGGPEVRQRTVEVPAGGSRLVTVTVTAPFATSGSSIFRVNATSTIDPGAASPSLVLSSTISTAPPRREVAVLVRQAEVTLEPGVETDIPVYLWNRGTRAGNFSLEVIESPVAGWTVDLVNGGVPVQRLALSNVPAGGIVEATLRATGPLSQTGATYPITLNATSSDVPGVAADRAMRFGLDVVGGVTMQVLDRVGAFGHLAELTGTSSFPAGDPNCNADPSAGYACFDDGATGVWYRVWVTNTGRVTEDFALGLEVLDWARTNDCTTTAFDQGGLTTPGSEFFRYYARSKSGRPVGITAIDDLPPGRTAEVYIWRAVDKTAETCEDSDTGNDFLSFLATARGLTTQSLATQSLRVIVENTGPSELERATGAGSVNQRPLLDQAVLLEGVGRAPMNPQKPDEGPFFVDTANTTSRELKGTVAVNGTATYRVRVTNAAAWGAYEDENGVLQSPLVQVRAEAVSREEGWNVSIRQVLDAIDNPPEHGNASVNVSNARDGRVEPWLDSELEITVKAPSAENGTALAGHRDTFFLIAKVLGSNEESILKVTTTIVVGAQIELAADTANLAVHAGEAGAALLTVRNVGGSEANATLRASIDPATPNAAAWRVDPASINFRVAALRNRTVALLVTPPAGTSAGATANVRISVDYTPTTTGNATLTLPVTVQPLGTLDVSAPQTDATIAPGGYANFTLNVRNRGNIPVPYRLTASPLPDWETTLGQTQDTLAAGETRAVSFVLKAPSSVENNARFASVVRAVEIGNDANFDAQPLGINILGGKAAPFVSAPLLQNRVDRGGVQIFPIEVRNTGSAAGRLALEVRAADPAWLVSVQDARGDNLTGIRLNPNELAVLNVSVRAPLLVPERTSVPIEVIAFSEDASQSSRINLRADIHDYGVQLGVTPARLDAAPGIGSEFILKVRNLGNDNDTLNVSAHLVDLPGWTVTLSSDRVPLQAGQEAEVRASVKSPISPMPTPRSYAFKFFAGTVQGAAVGVPKNDSVNAVVAILPHRSLDVDGDDQPELAVDEDNRAANGFESFREISADGVQSAVAAVAPLDGKTRFFLDVPVAGASPDGIADVWFDPEAVYAYRITHAPDVNQDGTPEYLVDTDRNAKIDRAYDTVSDAYWAAVEVNALGDAAVQYLVDTTGDGRPDAYYDPAAKRVSRTQSVPGQPNTIVGIDTDNDGKVDKYYDTRTKTVSDATVAKASGFFTKYWWFVALFVVMALVTVMLLVARRRRAD